MWTVVREDIKSEKIESAVGAVELFTQPESQALEQDLGQVVVGAEKKDS